MVVRRLNVNRSRNVNKLLTNLTTNTVRNLVDEILGEDKLASIVGPKIVIANHSSYLDHFVILDILKRNFPNQDVWFLTKQEAFDKKFSNWWHTNLNCIPVDRSGDATKAMMVLKKKLKYENGIVVIYPEGTRTPTGEMYLGKLGAETLSLLTRVPIIPIGLHSAFDTLPKFTKFPKINHRISVEIGDVIKVTKEDKDNLEQLSINNLKQISELASEEFNEVDLSNQDLKQVLMNSIIKNNELGIRNYSKSLHNVVEYYDRAIYVAKTLINNYELNNDNLSLVYIELARAYGRKAVNLGLNKIRSKNYLRKTKKYINCAEKLNRNNSELAYVKAYFNLFKNDVINWENELRKAVEIEPNNIKYLLSLAKASEKNKKHSTSEQILNRLIKLSPESQVDKRRILEAKVLLMRMSPEYGG